MHNMNLDKTKFLALTKMITTDIKLNIDNQTILRVNRYKYWAVSTTATITINNRGNQSAIINHFLKYNRINSSTL